MCSIFYLAYLIGYFPSFWNCFPFLVTSLWSSPISNGKIIDLRYNSIKFKISVFDLSVVYHVCMSQQKFFKNLHILWYAVSGDVENISKLHLGYIIVYSTISNWLPFQQTTRRTVKNC